MAVRITARPRTTRPKRDALPKSWGVGAEVMRKRLRREEEWESKQVQTVAQAQEQSRTIERLVGVFVLEGGAVDAHAARAYG